jgi:putative ABC transport system permease protein
MLRVETLEGRRIEGDIQLTGTVDELLGTNAYMNLYSLNRFLHEDHSISGALLRIDAGKQQQLYEYVKTLPSVAAVSVKEVELNSFRDTIDRSMRLSLGTLMIFAIIIASGMIYNGSRIALSERGRDLATLRVLGFSRKEITLILLGEQTIITIAALPFGFAAGYGMSALLASRFQTELYRIPLIVEPTSYAWSFLVVLCAAAISGVLIARRIARMNVVSVLKARE